MARRLRAGALLLLALKRLVAIRRVRVDPHEAARKRTREVPVLLALALNVQPLGHLVRPRGLQLRRAARRRDVTHPAHRRVKNDPGAEQRARKRGHFDVEPLHKLGDGNPSAERAQLHAEMDPATLGCPPRGKVTRTRESGHRRGPQLFNLALLEVGEGAQGARTRGTIQASR